MSETIAIANQKGGVGKTTTAVNLSASLAVAGKKVLLIDMDPQANATTGFDFKRKDYEYNIYHVLIGSKKLDETILATAIPTLDLVPSNIGLVGLEKEFYSDKNKSNKSILTNAIKKIKKNYDYIIIDCPPALGSITVSALSASDSVIIPIQCEYYALDGLAQLLNTVTLIRSTTNPDLKIKGLLPTMHTRTNNLSKQVLSELVKHFQDKLFLDKDKNCVIIPRNVKLAECPSFGKPIILYDKNSNGSVAYQNLAESILAS
ncbi:MAG: Chromosome (plasmid) partitioning protein ParA [uncultured Campylobacterales bacterium]|uniref:Chromosome (Plasmid) partitioning protein ParA n=1 Tax=uncultured Campylobacterales bacterium TaxID=352960 RepID=A0A6S6S8N7_9BACT|nr:MAG: Chromosome (plasmid) partitioning protein ParA [uncultured Campylobacterales bacterium]